jgi:hypothetical protein
MKIENHTAYDTRALRKLFAECEKHIFREYLKHGERKDRHICVKYTRKCFAKGWAYYNSRYIEILLPRPDQLGPDALVQAGMRRVAQVYLHEVGHNMGLKHAQMKKHWNINVEWMPDEFLPLAPVKAAKPKPNIVEVRAAHAQAKLDEWTKKVNRAKTLQKKWQKKVKYYEKKRAACPASKQ